MVYRGWYDGSATPNPGKLGLGITLYKDTKEIICGAKPAGHGTNNEAEYLALIFLLEMAVGQGITNIVVYGDSQLITNQVNGVWGVGKYTLKQHHESVSVLKRNFENIEFVWCKREKNKRADQLSKRAGEFSEQKIWISDCINKTDKNISVDAKNMTESDNTITPLDQKSVKVVSINRNNFLITDHFGISKLSLSPRLCCTCNIFYQKGECIHTNALGTLKSDLLRQKESLVM